MHLDFGFQFQTWNYATDRAWTLADRCQNFIRTRKSPNWNIFKVSSESDDMFDPSYAYLCWFSTSNLKLHLDYNWTLADRCEKYIQSKKHPIKYIFNVWSESNSMSPTSYESPNWFSCQMWVLFPVCNWTLPHCFNNFIQSSQCIIGNISKVSSESVLLWTFRYMLMVISTSNRKWHRQ